MVGVIQLGGWLILTPEIASDLSSLRPPLFFNPKGDYRAVSNDQFSRHLELLPKWNLPSKDKN